MVSSSACPCHLASHPRPQETQETEMTTSYVAQAGDTIQSIMSTFDVPLATLTSLNPQLAGNTTGAVPEGLIVNLPAGSSSTSAVSGYSNTASAVAFGMLGELGSRMLILFGGLTTGLVMLWMEDWKRKHGKRVSKKARQIRRHFLGD